MNTYIVNHNRTNKLMIIIRRIIIIIICIYIYTPHILAIGVQKLNSANHGHRKKLHSHIGSTVCRAWFASGSLFVHDYLVAHPT